MKKITTILMIAALLFVFVGVAAAEVNSVTPSTNDINKTNGWAHVNEISSDVGEVTLELVSTRNFASCFEYRADGDTAQVIGVNFNTNIIDGLYPYFCKNNSNSTHTFYANEYVEIRMVFGAETDERFDWTRFDVIPDIEIPNTTDVVASPNPAAVNSSVAVTANVDDTTTGDSKIASANFEIFDSEDVLVDLGSMSAVDAFDSPTEDVSATINAPETAGIYDLCVFGTDIAGNVGASYCIMFVVYDPSAGFVTGGGWIDSPEGAMSSFGAVWDQDFSVDDTGWLDDDDAWYGDIAVAGGTATFFGDGSSAPFSRFDGYRTTWPGTWVAEIDVYLNPAWPAGQGFDYSVAATGSDGEHQRDYIFHVGVVENYGPITGRALLVNGSNNADFYTNPYKLVNDNGGNYYNVAASGWYTLQHVFRDAGGYLAVDLNLVDSSGNILWTATRENAADTIPGEVGGNRYSWFTHIDVADGIEVDNHQLFLDMPSPEGKATFGFVSKYKKGATIPDGNTEFVFKAGDLNFHSTSYEWLVVTGSNFAKFKGEGTINGQGNYKFQIWAGDGSPDTFRIKIWNEDGGNEIVVYDNGMDQPIGGGSIVVHNK
jgi:hypothetical protein